MGQLVVVAIGGNSITKPGQVGTIPEQYENARETAVHLGRMVEKGYRLVVSHGNGPQVGSVLRRVEIASGEIYPLPLDTCDSSTIGGMGYMLQQVIGNELRARGIGTPVATIITQVVVAEDDPACTRPEKPIGRYYTAEEAAAKRRDLGWIMAEERGRGFRRVVPSPRPLEIVELPVIRAALDAGAVVIAAGGGGIPVVRRGAKLRGLEAVVDKDRSSALLARSLEAPLFVISTAVDRVSIDFRRPTERPLDRLTLAEARRYLAEGQFPAGSMGPKIEAACDFLERGGERAIITSPERLTDALEGRAGTQIVADGASGSRPQASGGGS